MVDFDPWEILDYRLTNLRCFCQQELLKKYKIAIKNSHPDSSPQEDDQAAKINQAYKILKDPISRLKAWFIKENFNLTSVIDPYKQMELAESLENINDSLELKTLLNLRINQGYAEIVNLLEQYKNAKDPEILNNIQELFGCLKFLNNLQKSI